ASLAFADVDVFAVVAHGASADDRGHVGQAAVSGLGAVDDFLQGHINAALAGVQADDAALQVEPADAPVGHIGDHHAAPDIHHRVGGFTKLRLDARPAVARVNLLSIARDRRNDARFAVHFAHDGIQAIGDVQVGVRINDDGVGSLKVAFVAGPPSPE